MDMASKSFTFTFTLSAGRREPVRCVVCQMAGVQVEVSFAGFMLAAVDGRFAHAFVGTVAYLVRGDAWSMLLPP